MIKGKINIIYLGEITDAPIIEYTIVKKYDDNIIIIKRLSFLHSTIIFFKLIIIKVANVTKKIAPNIIDPKNDLK